LNYDNCNCWLVYHFASWEVLARCSVALVPWPTCTKQLFAEFNLLVFVVVNDWAGSWDLVFLITHLGSRGPLLWLLRYGWNRPSICCMLSFHVRTSHYCSLPLYLSLFYIWHSIRWGMTNSRRPETTEFECLDLLDPVRRSWFWWEWITMGVDSLNINLWVFLI
jgi:hypothetical protein